MTSQAVRVNAHLYMMAPVDVTADFSRQRLVAFVFQNDPRLPRKRGSRALSLIPQTPGRLGASPEPEPTGPTREAGDCPPFPCLAGTNFEDSE